MYPAALAHHRDRETSTRPAISPPKPRCSTRRNGPGPADAVQRCHPSFQQSLGLTSHHGKEKGRQPAVLCGLQATQRGYREGRTSHSSHRRPPRRSTRGRWFSILDLKSGYCQAPIQERDKEKTAFRTSSGQLFKFNQVPFGLCNSPATFSRLMDRVLAGIHWETCLFYLDDIIVFTATWEEHLDRLRQVFERLRHAQLKLGADKCSFSAKEISYLGHRVTKEGLVPDPSLLAAIREISPPKNATEVCSFLSLAGHYRRYVKNFSAIAGPLHELTRKDAVFHWDPDCQDAFDRLKTLLTTSPITDFPDFSLPFWLYTDVSTTGLGAILAQVREGKERIICCASRSLNAINVRSHRTLNNMLRARLLEGPSTKSLGR